QYDLDAVYFDTADLALARGRITLRRRTGGHDAGWHLKLPAGTSGRQEVRLPLGRARKHPPRELRTATLAFTRGADLAPVAMLRTSRTVHRLLGRDGSCLAEVCADEVNAFDGSSSHSLLAWREWEVELVEGDAELLTRVDAVMASVGVSVAQAPSKLARVLGDRITPPPSPPRPCRKGPIGALLQTRLAEQLEVLKRRDVDVRRDANDGIHQLRVAMRRLRSALATFRPLVDREVTDPLRDELQWVAALLGEARDAEVMAQRLDTAVSKLPGELVLGAVTTRIDLTLGNRYREGLATALEAMESRRYVELLNALDRLVADPPWTPLGDQPAKDVLPTLLKRDWKRLRKQVSRADSAADPHTRDVALHESRKAAKRLRYAAETARPVLGKDAKQITSVAKAAQTRLGDHQDSVVTRSVLRDLGIQAHLDGDTAFTFGLLHGLEQTHAVMIEQEFSRTWKTTYAPKLRALLR
ncbi:MAG: CHAD domain-containing protein, partial [Nocardioidaceae bacterium]